MNESITIPPALDLRQLLPLRAAAITLEFLGPARFRFFHHGAVTAFLRTLLEGRTDYDLYLTVDCPENGRTDYRAGDRYVFALYCLPGGEPLLETVLDGLRQLPFAARCTDAAVPLRNNLRLVEARDLFGRRLAYEADQFAAYGPDDLEEETQFWMQVDAARLCWHSPARLLLPKAARGDAKGEARFCRDSHHLDLSLLLDRLHDAPADILRRRGLGAAPRVSALAPRLRSADLFWADARYRDANGAEAVMGGLLGVLELPSGPVLDEAAWRALVLGQYLGVGQRRAFGLGRYRLESAEGETTAPAVQPAASLLRHACREDNLLAAWRAIDENRKARRRAKQAPHDEDEWETAAAEARELPGDETEARAEDARDRLLQLGGELTSGRYRPPPLYGVVIKRPDGGVRPLAVPTFMDRVAQRALVQVLAPGLEDLMYHGSFGYRPRRSRHGASRAIQQAYQEGFRWAYESDIDDFFDTVDWRRLRTRLECLFGNDPAIDLILAWVGAYVVYEGERVERSRGLPQGSPLAPLLANVFLDDFDSDLETAGFRLVRFADDFVVLCRDKAQAQAAGEAVQRSLAQLGLDINAAKSGIVHFSEGFRYLGYVFVNGLAVDVSGEPRPQPQWPVTSLPPPPASWFAALAQRRPAVIHADGILAPEDPVDAVAAPRLSFSAPPVAVGEFESAAPAGPDQERPGAGPNAPLRAGQRAAHGTMLFVTGAPALVTTKEERLRVERDDEEIATLAWNTLDGVVLFGAHHITTPALREALEHNVPVCFATGTGRWQGMAVNGMPGQGGVELWLAQAQILREPATALALARSVVESRLRHMKEVLRQRIEARAVEEPLKEIDKQLGRLPQADSLSALHGMEGYGTAAYFAALKEIVPKEFGFEGRMRRPPTDPFNAMLSFGYTILHSHIETIIRACGLLPWAGFYHQVHGRHETLASDLIESFRHLIERTALTAVTRGQLKPGDFHRQGAAGCRFVRAALREYIRMVSERLEAPVTALGDDEPRSALEHIRRQCLALEDFLHGASPEFKAWRTR